MKRFIQYLVYWREIYIFIPLAILSLWAHQALYSGLMGGREPIDPPVDLVHVSRQLYFVFLIGGVVGLFQKHLFGYRSKGPAPRLRDDLYDACITIFLFLFIAWCLR